jgi:hypothetical protein
MTCDLCEKKGIYADVERTSMRCPQHKIHGMLDVMNPICDECHKRARFTLHGHTRPYKCKDHLIQGMVDVNKKKCAFNECMINPTFGYSGGKSTHCSKHSLPDMISLRSRACLTAGCDKRAKFGLVKSTHCPDHKTQSMKDFGSRKCLHVGDDGERCTSTPLYSPQGVLFAMYCGIHRGEDMFETQVKRCLKCRNMATHSRDYFTEPSLCKNHVTEGYVDYIFRPCIDPSCGDETLYGWRDDKVRRACQKHRVARMSHLGRNKFRRVIVG